MRNGVNVLVAVLIAGSAAACGGEDEIALFEGEEAATPSPDTALPARPAGDVVLLTSQFEASADADAADQRLTGTLRVSRTVPAGGTSLAGDGANIRLEASVDGLTQGDHAWHIHAGTCAEHGAIVVALSRTEDLPGLTQSLTADESGHAEGTVTIPFDELAPDELRTGRYSAHIHAGAGTDHGPTVMCAELAAGA